MFTHHDLKATIDTIGAASHILCVSHVSPDGDAVGSLLGMGWILRSMGRHPILALADRVPDNLTTLPGAVGHHRPGIGCRPL